MLLHFSCFFLTAFALIFIFFTRLFSPHQACNQNDHDSLLAISHAFTPVRPLNWSSSIDCCVWEGILCDQKGWVTHLELPSRGLTGSMPPTLGNLTHLSHLNLSHNSLIGPLLGVIFSSLNLLQTIDLSFNSLVGEIPASYLYSNSSTPILLETIDLSSNKFCGEMPSFLQAVGNLVTLNISNNGFSGTLPSSICISTSSTRVLDFSFNDFEGPIPLGFGKCSRLEVFKAGFNHLSGELPGDIYSALTLREISLPSNRLVGSINDGIVGLANLTVFELNTNNLNDTLPMDIGKLSNLEKLILHMNGLSGTVPASLFNCTNLQKLSLLSNHFHGDISNFDFSKLQKLTTLDMGGNNFTGQLPKSLYSCKSLRGFRFCHNELQGQITSDILTLQSLTFISLSYNQYTNVSGAIKIFMGLKKLKVLMISGMFLNEVLPSKVDSVGFKELQYLEMARCQLKGQIPTWLKGLHKLSILNLAENQLRGKIPSWLGTLLSLYYINMHSNYLSGPFPQILTDLPALQHNSSQPDQTYLDLPIIFLPQLPKPNDVPSRIYNQISNIQPMIDFHNNCLQGEIPQEIGQLKRLLMLDFNQNELSGEIPNQISHLSNLEKLDLSHNHLFGEIPQSLGGLSFLSAFNVSFNNLSGQIPTSTQMQNLDVSAFAGNTGLYGLPLGLGKSRDGNGTQAETQGKEEEVGDDGIENLGFYVSLGLGFIVGFWGVCGSFWVKPSYRSAYFQFLEGINDWLYVKLALMSKGMRMMTEEKVSETWAVDG